MKNLSRLVHNLFCHRTHLQQMELIRENLDNPNVCLYYLEEVINNAHELRDHVRWQNEATRIMDDLGVDEPIEAFNLLNRSLAVTQALTPLIQQHPRVKRLIIRLIEIM